MSRTNLGDALKNTPIGRDLDEPDRQALSSLMGQRQLEDNEVLTSEGDHDRTLFVLIDGELSVCTTVQGGKLETVYTMRPGDVAGTGAFVEGIERLATLRSHGAAVVLTLEPDAFESLLDERPRLVYAVMKSLFRARHHNLVQLYQENEQLTNYITKMHGRY
jgi:CRP-like cAMP-binding protein